MPITKIIVPLDGSPLAQRVLPYSRSLALRLEVPVELLHVIDPVSLMPSVVAKSPLYDDVLSVERQKTIDYLKKVARFFLDSLAVGWSVEIGDPAEGIIRKAASQSGSLIAMATHGRSGVQRWLLGSVADKVLRMAANPLFLVRAKEMKIAEEVSLKKVVVPLDGSPLAEKALPYIVELAKKMNLEVLLIRVWGLPATTYFGSADYETPDLKRIAEEITAEAKSYLERKAEQLKREGLATVSQVLLPGNAAQEIINFARQTPDSLVAMCTHGRSGLRRLVPGSITDRVVRHSGDPVLVVPASISLPTLQTSGPISFSCPPS